MLIQGNAIKIPLPDRSVHCAVTSPPYWGLRKYSGSQGRIWGGDPECEHEWGMNKASTVGHRGERPELPNPPAGWSTREHDMKSVGGGQFCQLCGAWYGSLGLEPTPEQHVENIVEICREVRRVLRDDGVFWLNYGDCYAGSGGENANTGLNRAGTGQDRSHLYRNNPRILPRVPQGSLMMMPHRVALALQQDGWIIRQDLVWFKRNPMPESVNGWRWQREREKTKPGAMPRWGNTEQYSSAMPSLDDYESAEWEYGDDLELRKGSWRHTRAHEYVFMLTKKMGYYSNQEAVREAGSENIPWGESWGGSKQEELGHNRGGKLGAPAQSSGRNPRSVLDVPTVPYKGAHYATFPPNLIAPLIRATCPRWACPVCGQGWAVVVEKNFVGAYFDADPEKRLTQGARQDGKGPVQDFERGQVKGYRPTCEHPHTQEEAVPGICFDPFVGSGTTVAVAQQLLRRGIGLDISRPYLQDQAVLRTGGTPSLDLEELPLFAGR